jgi:hypothetical protein
MDMTDQQPPATPPPFIPPPYTPPPSSPPAWPSPDAGEPTATQPPVAPPAPGQAWGAPQYGAPAPPPPAPAKKGRAGLIIGLLVVALLVIGGIVGVALVMGGSSGDLALVIDSCEISADGRLSATGTVDGPDGTGVRVEVEFVDSATGELADTAGTSVDVGSGNSWTVTGSAGAEVQQVTCNVTADD